MEAKLAYCHVSLARLHYLFLFYQHHLVWFHWYKSAILYYCKGVLHHLPLLCVLCTCWEQCVNYRRATKCVCSVYNSVCMSNVTHGWAYRYGVAMAGLHSNCSVGVYLRGPCDQWNIRAPSFTMRRHHRIICSISTIYQVHQSSSGVPRRQISAPLVP
jgi:hypothetical protein